MFISVVKDPPFSIKESGYAGFIFPIEIYLKNKDEPKKIKFTYDFTLQQSGFLKDRYIFQSPNEEFRKKLLKGGGLPVSNNTFYTNPDQESRSRDSFTEDKQQLLSKPKLSLENVKKHKVKEHKEEVPHRTSSFENLFGMPIQKPPKVSPDPKKLEKPAPPPPKPDKKDKERNTEKKSKHEHKESKPDKIKIKEEKDKIRSEKLKSHSKDQDKVKEKINKRPNERPATPDQVKKRCLSPVRKAPSPLPPRSSSASSMKEDFKILKQNADLEMRKPKFEEKTPDTKADKETKEKKKKEKKSHDRDKDRKERKESKKENQKIKESPINKEPPKEIPKEIPKARETPKETLKESAPVKEKPPKPEKAINKFSIENLRKTPPPEEEKSAHHKSKEKSDPDRKHKHKKKDKKREESREKHKESGKEKKHKHDKAREAPPEKPEPVELRETPVLKERPVAELASPISLDTASQCSSKSGIAKTSQINDDINSSHSDSESSIVNEEEEKPKIENPSPEPIKPPSPEPEPEPELETEPEPVVEAPPPQLKEKSKKHKDKSSKREEKRRKRKAAEEEDAENRKVAKTSDPVPTITEPERGESSGSVTTETKVQDNGVSSSLGEEPEPGDLSPDYMVQLRELQQRIMKIKNNEELERVVNLIAETGRYEVTTQTFDFDLCLLDRSTVQQLIQLVGC